MTEKRFIPAPARLSDDSPPDDAFRLRQVQNEKLASIGQIAAGVAHEINNPIGYIGSNLNTLQGYMTSLLHLIDRQQALLALCSQTDADRQQVQDLSATSDLDYIREDLPQLMRESLDGIDRIRHTVRDLKDFSRMDDIAFSWVDVHDVLNSALNMVHYELKYVAEVERRYAQLPRIWASAPQISQVLVNLLLNAAQAIAEEGRILLTTRQVGDWVEIEVEDNGQGMPPDECERVFDPFYSTKPAGTGTGLGLSISANIVADHEGVLAVASTPGVGSCFRIQLPVQAAANRGARV